MNISSKTLHNITFTLEELKALNTVLILLEELGQELSFEVENIETGEVIDSEDIQRVKGILHGLWLGGWWAESEG